MRWLLCVWMVVGACAVAGRPPAPPRRASLGLSISSMTLGNGLRVVVVNDPRATEVQVTTRYAVGAADDPQGKPGMAHLVEHLMHQQILGTQSLFAQLESIATSFNALTMFDSTVYYARAAPSQLEKLLAIEATRVGFRCTSITEEQFLRERDVVMGEIKRRSGFEDVTAAVHRGLFEPGHPYRRSIGGSLATVGGITFAEACEFADRHYTTEGTAMVVSGNVTPEYVSTALRKFVARIAKRAPAPRDPLARAELRTERIPIEAAIDDGALVFVWRLPAEPLPLARALALVPAMVSAIDGEVAGQVSAMHFGGERVPLVGIVVERTTEDDVDDLVKAVRRAVDDLVPDTLEQTNQFELGELAFSHVQQAAIHGLYAGLEEGSDRDMRLARYAATARDPSVELAAEFEAVRGLTTGNAAALAREAFASGKAAIIELKPAERSQGRRLAVAAVAHDVGPRREVPDAAEAQRPAEGSIAAEPPVESYELPNGMRVVLVSHSSVPIVEMRLVFASGNADDPVSRRGSAALATYGLTFDTRHLNDVLKFYAAGGGRMVDLDADRATFVVRGVDMHLDMLLAGLRRWVRDGIYTEGADAVAEALRRAHKQSDDDSTLAAAWQAALYGALHPYSKAGIVPYMSAKLSLEDAEQFRSSHFVPDNATLVIAGHFDPALARRWVDYLFSDWAGGVPSMPREAAPAAKPAALAMSRNSALTRIQIAFPGDAGTRAQRIVAAAMLSILARDVRHQLGAAYSVDAALVERRRATRYVLGGDVDSSRAADAIQFLRDGLATLATDREAGARAFVLARKRALVQLQSVAGSATALASRIEHDIELARQPLSDLDTARAVQALTFDGMAPVLAELDLARAVVLAAGPEAEMTKLFAVLGRTPTEMKFDAIQADTIDDPFDDDAPMKSREREPVTLRDLEDALTDDPPIEWGFALRVAGGHLWGHTVNTTARITETCCSGFGASAFVGLRYDKQKAVGVYLSLASLEGSHYVDFERMNPRPTSETPIDIGIAFEGNAFGRLWGSVYVGLHLDHKTRPMPEVEPREEWSSGLGVGMQLGFDALAIAGHRIGPYIHGGGTLAASTGYGAIGAGVAYRY